MGYLFSLNFTEYLTKTVKSLPNFLQHSFYKYCNPKKYSKKNHLYIENEMQQFFNNIANILASNDESKRGNKPLFARNDHSGSSKILKMICWCYLRDHKLTSCIMFISLTLEKKKKFVKEKQLCWNCLSKRHKIKHCVLTTKCHIDSCNKKHHKLLHDLSFKLVNLSNLVNLNPSEENIQKYVLSSSFTNSAFLQIIQ